MSDPRLIALDGELDLASVSELRDRLARVALDGAGGAVLDLSQVSFIDSSGLGVILDVDRLARDSGRRLTIVAPRGTAASSLLTLTGVRRRLSVFESLRAAVDALPGVPRV